MQCDDYPVEVILKEARRFMVPLYQRKYQWTDRRLNPFWEDVEAKAAEILDGESRFQHYMGALILSPVGPVAQIGVTPKVQVVDGQQRLTTFQLFLAALREVARDCGETDLIEHVEDYLFNQLKSKDNDPLTRYKLTPTPSDRNVFHDIVDNPYRNVSLKYRRYYWGRRVPKNTQLRALRAYWLFRAKIKHFAHYGPTIKIDGNSETISDETDTEEAVSYRLEALLTSLLSRMKLVVIILGEDDDAQVIFETLNSKGEPLLAMDLVRNNIFHRAEKETASVEALYNQLWDPFDDSWWRQPAPFARPRRPRIDHFLAHTLAAETGESISMRELYAEYRAFAVPKGEPRFKSVEDELKVLEDYRPLYEVLERRKQGDETLAWLGSKFAAWQVTTAYPVTMQLWSGTVSQDEREQIGRLIYSYIVRRTLCGLTSKNLNKAFQSLAHLFIRCAPSVAAVKEHFSTRTGDSLRFPSDEEFRRGVLSNPVYRLAHGTRLKDVLWEFELASRSRLAEQITMPADLWVEHLLPIAWHEGWPFEDGVFVERTAEDPKVYARNLLIDTLGNLTLLSSRLNQSSGNKSFDKKMKKFEDHTGLFLNKWFNRKSVWAEAEIRERSEHMADLATQIWPSL